LLKKKREKDLSIELINGSIIMFGGTDDGSFVGQGGGGYLLGEASLHKSDAMGYIAPIQEESDAFVISQGTMRGKQNHLYRLFEANCGRNEWFSQWLLPEATKMYYWKGGEIDLNPELEGRISPYTGRLYRNIQDLVDSRKISHALARQEFLNEAVLSNEDGYYAYEYREAKKSNRIGAGLPDPNLPVYTFWDIGKGEARNNTDAMAMWMVQFPDNDLPSPKRIQMIGFHETRGGVWADHARTLREIGYEYGGHFAPWDIKMGRAGLDGNNLQWAREAGIEFTPVPQRNFGIMEGIELCRRAWSLVSFSRGSAMDGAERLSEYREKRDRDGNYMGKPEHSSRSSNVADSFRTLVEALNKKMVRYDPPNDATQASQSIEILTMRHAGEGPKEIDVKPMLCGKGVGVTRRTKEEIIRQRKEKIERRRQIRT